MVTPTHSLDATLQVPPPGTPHVGEREATALYRRRPSPVNGSFLVPPRRVGWCRGVEGETDVCVVLARNTVVKGLAPSSGVVEDLLSALKGHHVGFPSTFGTEGRRCTNSNFSSVEEPLGSHITDSVGVRLSRFPLKSVRSIDSKHFVILRENRYLLT